MKQLCLLLGLLAAWFPAASQIYLNLVEREWKPDPSYFQVRYDSFPDAEAVMIREHGDLFANRANMTLNYNCVIHVLRESGKSFGEVEVFYHKGDELLTVDYGYCYNLSPEGEIIVSEISRDQVFRSEVAEDVMSMRFNLPNVREGSIIKFGYTRTSNSLFSHLWNFQSEIPKLRSELKFLSHEELGYSYIFVGSMVDKFNFDGKALYSMDMIPAAKKEPYVPDEEIYQPKVRFQLIEYLDRGMNRIVKVFPDWEEFGQDLLARDEFSLSRKQIKALSKQVKEVCKTSDQQEQKARDIYRFVQRNTNWNGEYRIFPDQSPIDLLESGSGSAADINFLLYSMLLEAGLEPRLALVGTRGYSVIVEEFTVANQFNCLMTQLDLGGKSYALDATNPYRPFELPAKAQLNRRYLVLDKHGTHWEDIPINQETEKNVNGILNIDEDGTVKGNLAFISKGYEAVAVRQILARSGLDSLWIWRLPASMNASVIEEATVIGKSDPDSTLTINVSFRIDEFALAAGDLLYIPGMVLDRIEENPFKEESRLYPIDYSYPAKASYRITFVMPEGFEVEELPESGQLILPNREMAYVFTTEDIGVAISVLSMFSLNQTFYHPSALPSLRMMYDEVNSRQGQQIILRKVGTDSN